MRQNIIFIAIFFSLLVFSNQLHSQELSPDDQFLIAKDYIANNELEKAKSVLDKLSKKDENAEMIYGTYLSLLSDLNKGDEKKKYLKRLNKKFPENYKYFIDYHLDEFQNTSQTKKLVEELQSRSSFNMGLSKLIASYLTSKNLPKASIRYLENQRKSMGQKHLFSFELADLYATVGNKEKYYEELFSNLSYRPNDLNKVQDILQEEIVSSSTENIEKKLYEYIQKNPDQNVYNKLLIWYYLQKKNYNQAFIQAKSLDKRNLIRNKNDTRLIHSLDVARKAKNSQEYEQAIQIYEYIVNNTADYYSKGQAKKELIDCKQEKIKEEYPIDTLFVQSLVSDYQSLLKNRYSANQKAEIYRKLAELETYFLHNLPNAEKWLLEIEKQGGIRWQTKALAKIELADIYLLKNEPWESTLLYSQAEKLGKENDIGHQAKLKNAKLSYYRANFKLAKEQLSILKRATTRKISNDAIDLALLIQNNLYEDTTEKSLAAYAAIELLVFQNKYQQAENKLDSLDKITAAQYLQDESLWLRSKIHEKKNEFSFAAVNLEKLITVYNNKALEDDAIFRLATIYHKHLGELEKAKKYYKKLLTDYPESLYSAESRKRFRMLRGDQINQ